jgi:hypothetical protein
MKNFLKTYWLPLILIPIGLYLIIIGVITSNIVGDAPVKTAITSRQKPSNLSSPGHLRSEKPIVRQCKTPAILKVGGKANEINVRVNAASIRKGSVVRVYIDYCMYEGTIQADGTAHIKVDWSPPHSKVKVGVWQVDNSKDIGGGHLLCSTNICVTMGD